MNQLKSRSALFAVAGVLAAVLLGPVATAPAQEPTTAPAPPSVPPGCVLTSAGLVCNTPTPFPTTTVVPTRTAIPTETADDDEGEVKNEESDSGDTSPAQQVSQVPVRRLAFTGLQVWLTFLSGLALVGGGVALRRHVQRT